MCQRVAQGRHRARAADRNRHQDLWEEHQLAHGDQGDDPIRQLDPRWRFLWLGWLVLHVAALPPGLESLQSMQSVSHQSTSC